MTIHRARIIKGAFVDEASRPRGDADPRRSVGARLVPREIVDARAEAARIVDEARAKAGEIANASANAAAKEAREVEVARLAAGFLALRHAEARQRERELDRVIELALLLAERLIGETIRLEPARVGELAASVLREARGANKVRIEACPEDIASLKEALEALGRVVDVRPDPTLGRGSLVVHTDLGQIDARLEPQLARLATALREALG